LSLTQDLRLSVSSYTAWRFGDTEPALQPKIVLREAGCIHTRCHTQHEWNSTLRSSLFLRTSHARRFTRMDLLLFFIPGHFLPRVTGAGNGGTTCDTSSVMASDSVFLHSSLRAAATGFGRGASLAGTSAGLHFATDGGGTGNIVCTNIFFLLPLYYRRCWIVGGLPMGMIRIQEIARLGWPRRGLLSLLLQKKKKKKN
jgi:hypothetical protein